MKFSPAFLVAARKWMQSAVPVLLLVIGFFTRAAWWPAVSGWIDGTIAQNKSAQAEAHGHSHATVAENHNDAEHGHEPLAETTLELSAQARKNLGLTSQYLQPVKLSTYRKYITVPAIIVERPGRTQLHVSAPLTGVVTHVHAVTGETVTPGMLLFEIRLTHEDLVSAQTEFLRTLGELEVERREIARLQEASLGGAIAGKTLLDHQYSQDKLDALLKAQREALRLHGLSDRQIDEIIEQKQLLRDLHIVAPGVDLHEHHDEELRFTADPLSPVSVDEEAKAVVHVDQDKNLTPLVVEHLDVHKGQAVAAGGQLCTLADLSRVYIEGQAFEQEADAVSQSTQNKWPVTAVLSTGASAELLEKLTISFVKNSVDREARTLSFYVELPNEILRDETSGEGQRFVSWKHRLGQRLQLRVPIEEWADQLVLPVEAAVKEGPDWFVFREDHGHFDRIPVHVKHRDQSNIVIESDGAIQPGDVLALKSAHQMQMAIKNKSGAGVDPHAGHTH